MNKFRIAYFGDGPWSHKSLEQLLNRSEYEIVLVVVRNDHRDPELIRIAEANNIEVTWHEDVNSDEFKLVLESLNAENLLCIAYDINGDSESILTNSIKGWEKINIEFEKKPCIFLVN